MTELFLPTLHTFAMKNTFTGSSGMLRYRVVPQVVMLTDKEVDFEQSTIFAEYWHGLLCYEKSQMEGSESFPMSQEGLESMRSWLISKI